MSIMMLCVPEQVKEIIYSTNADYSLDNPKFIGAIAQASAQIAAYTRRRLQYGLCVDSFDIPANYNGHFRLYTSGIPIDLSRGNPECAVQGTSCRYTAGILSSLAVINPDLGVLAVNTTGAARNIALRYYAGFKPFETQPEVPGANSNHVFYDVPYEIQIACAAQASFTMQRNMKNETGKRGDEGSTVAKESVMNLTPDAAKLLATYVRPRYMGAR